MDGKLLAGVGIGVGGTVVLVLVLGLSGLLGGSDDLDDFEDLAAQNPAVAAALAAERRGEVPPAAQPRAAARGAVMINGRALDAQQIQEIHSVYGVEPIPGKYWYDPMSGLYGIAGQPSAGFMYPGHDYGPLSATASGGGTGVFVNGRQLPAQEVMVFSAIWGTYIQPARYWLDGMGNVGYEGMPVPVGNLYAQAARTGEAGGSGGGGDNFWNTRFSAGNYNSDNTSGYVSVPGYGPVGYGLD